MSSHRATAATVAEAAVMGFFWQQTVDALQMVKDCCHSCPMSLTPPRAGDLSLLPLLSLGRRVVMHLLLVHCEARGDQLNMEQTEIQTAECHSLAFGSNKMIGLKTYVVKEKGRD